MNPPQPTGYVLWRGASQIDGRTPIVAIATLRSTNSKTGDMIQTWILNESENPYATIANGADSAICGQCPHRPALYREASAARCYVSMKAPSSIYRTLSRDKYPDWQGEPIAAGRMVRLGAYGDPAAVPIEVWTRLLDGSRGHTGYTHQWRLFPEFASICQASVDFDFEIPQAEKRGFRVFYVTRPDATLPETGRGFVRCPASKESGHRTTCERCGLCNGANGNSRKHIVINAH